MEGRKPSSHSFIVKLWVEDHDAYPPGARLRGYVTHVPSGARCYIEEVHQVVGILLPYLRTLSIDTSFGWRLRQWLRCSRLFLLSKG